MKSFLITLFTSALLSLSKCDVREQFRIAMAKYADKDHINLAEGLQARTARFHAFTEFHARVEAINNDDTRHFVAEDNFLSILTAEERSSRLGLNSTRPEPDDDDVVEIEQRQVRSGDLPAHRDFSDILPDIKDQDKCGSCWTYSAVAALEGEIFFKTGDRKVSLSEMEFLECASDRDYDGCQGGWMQWCFKYAKNKDRIAPSEAYPYKPIDRQKCNAKGKANALRTHNVKIRGFTMIKGAKLLEEASKHVLSVAIFVNEDFLAYASGLYMDENCDAWANHAVALVGYGERSGIKYWKVRNSWGKDWGEGGYIYMNREVSNICRIKSEVMLPLVKCRNGRCKGVTPDEADGGKEEFATEERKEGICHTEVNMSDECDEDATDALQRCIDSGIPRNECWIYTISPNCYKATLKGDAKDTMIDMAHLCEGSDKTEDMGWDTCLERRNLSPCQDSKEAAAAMCRLSGTPEEHCFILKATSKCYRATVPGTVGGELIRPYPCNREVDPAKDCSKDFGPGVVYCYDCQCCKHSNFCMDYDEKWDNFY